jgi:hypothetical protein
MTASDPVIAADAALAGFIQSIELAVTDAYETVLPLLGDAARPIAVRFQGHHREYADALAKQAAGSVAKLPNQTLTLVLAARLQGVADERGALTFAFGLENQVAETYAFSFTTLTSPDVIRLAASILPVVSAHAAALGSLAGLPPAGAFPNGPFEGTAVAGADSQDITLGFDPLSFPVG